MLTGCSYLITSPMPDKAEWGAMGEQQRAEFKCDTSVAPWLDIALTAVVTGLVLANTEEQGVALGGAAAAGGALGSTILGFSRNGRCQEIKMIQNQRQNPTRQDGGDPTAF